MSLSFWFCFSFSSCFAWLRWLRLSAVFNDLVSSYYWYSSPSHLSIFPILHPHSSPSRTIATAILTFFSPFLSRRLHSPHPTYYLLRTRLFHLFDRHSRRWTSGRRVLAFGWWTVSVTVINPHIPYALSFFFFTCYLCTPQLCEQPGL